MNCALLKHKSSPIHAVLDATMAIVNAQGRSYARLAKTAVRSEVPVDGLRVQDSRGRFTGTA